MAELQNLYFSSYFIVDFKNMSKFMDMKDMLFTDMQKYYDGKMNFMVGICKQLKFR